MGCDAIHVIRVCPSRFSSHTSAFFFQRLPPTLLRYRHLRAPYRQHDHRLHFQAVRPRFVRPRLGRRLWLSRRVCERVRSWRINVEEGMAFERVEQACCGAAHGWRCKSWTRLLRISRRLWRKRTCWKAKGRWLRCTVSLCRLLVLPRMPR